MREDVRSIARLAGQDRIFQALGRAALKARARSLFPGEVIAVDGLELAVQEDEQGDGTVVQLICEKAQIERLAETDARQLGTDLQALTDRERREVLGKILAELSRMLLKWQGISMRSGPGENLTFEKSVYKKDESWR